MMMSRVDIIGPMAVVVVVMVVHLECLQPVLVKFDLDLVLASVAILGP